MNKLKRLFFLLSILTISNITYANKLDAVDFSMDSLFVYAMDLSYFNPSGLDEAVDKMQVLLKQNPSSYNTLLFTGLLFIQRSNSLSFDKATHILYKKVRPRIMDLPLNKRLRIEKAISYYLQNTNRDYQFLAFHKQIFKAELLKSNDYVFKINSFFTISWNLEEDKVFGNMKTEYQDIALDLYDEYSINYKNDTIESLMEMYKIAQCLEINCEPFEMISKYLSAMRASKKIGYDLMYSFQAYKIGCIYLEEEAYESAEKFLLIAVENSDQFPIWQGHYISEYAHLLEVQGLYEKAIHSYGDAFDKFVELVCFSDNSKIENNVDKFIFILDHLTSCYLKLDNPTEGYKCFQMAKEMKKANYLDDYSNVDYFFESLNKSLEKLNYTTDKNLIDSFFKDHNIHEKYPDFSPSLEIETDTSLVLDFQDKALKTSRENQEITIENTMFLEGFKNLSIIIAFLFFVLTIGLYLKYRKTKKRFQELNENFESLNVAYLESKNDLKKINRKLTKIGEPNFIQISNVDKTFLNYKDILYIEAKGSSVHVHTVNKQMIKGNNLFKYYREKLPKSQFVRIHRSYLVNNKEIKKIVGTVVEMNTGVELPVGKTYLDELYSVAFDLL